MPQHGVGRVVDAEELNLFLAELDLGGRHRLFNMSNFAGIDDCSVPACFAFPCA